MIRRRSHGRSDQVDPTLDESDFHQWVLSLPWVVERPTDGTSPGVRIFAVDCQPLHRRQLWLVTGLDQLPLAGELNDIAAIMPLAATRTPQATAWEVRQATPLPADHVLVSLKDEVSQEHEDIEAFVLAAYNYAMS
jgi:hypothetical protein